MFLCERNHFSTPSEPEVKRTQAGEPASVKLRLTAPKPNLYLNSPAAYALRISLAISSR